MVPLRSNSESTSNAATATAMHEVAQMRLELERLKWMHEQEIAELKHNHDLTVAEIRQSLEYEKKQLLLDAKVQAEAARIRAIDETKRKQWCAFCNKEAIFYCCWNTSYCDYPCQQKHWPQHMNSCTQARESGAAGPAAMETNTSPPTNAGNLVHSIKNPSMNITSSTLPAKPVTTTVSPGRTTITISASPGHLSRLTSGGKSTIIMPPSVAPPKQTLAPVEKVPLKISPAVSAELKTKKVSQPVPTESMDKITGASLQKSGLAISAIGARLLAAKQRSNNKDPNRPVLKSTTSKLDSPASPVSDSAQMSADHVKTTLESPLSPDAKPSSPSPKDLISPLVVSSKVIIKSEKDPRKPTVASTEKPTETSKTKSISGPTSDQIPTKSQLASVDSKSAGAISSSAPATEMAEDPPPTKAAASKPTSAIFSSPSAVASLIADMGTPLSSTLSSPESSSFSDTPEKKPDSSKVQLSLAGSSAFTKFLPDSSKPHIQGVGTGKAEKAQSDMSLASKLTSGSSDTSMAATFKPIDAKSNVDATFTTAVEKNSGMVPIIPPVLADSYLSSLQKTLVEKIGTSPIPPGVPELPTSKSELFRPALLVSGNASKKDSDTETTKSEADQPMEVDSNC